MKYKNNITITYLTTFLGGLEFALPIMALYYRQQLGSVLLITIILAIKSGSILLLEVPTGLLTDHIGRKTTLILSSCCGLAYLGFLLLGSWFSPLLSFTIAVICFAVGSTLSSGTSTSLVYESLRMIDDPPSFKRVMAIKHSLWPIGASIASLLGGIMATIDLRLPIAMMILPTVVSLYLKLQLSDPFDPEVHQHNSAIVTARQSIQILRKNRQVLILLGLGFFSYIGEVSHQLKPLYYEFKGIDLALFGLLVALTHGMSFLGSLLSDPVTSRVSPRATLIGMGLFSQVLLLGSMLTTGLLSGLLLITTSIGWGIKWPVIADLLNQELEDRHRTTVLSFSNMFKMLSFTAFSPLFGYLVDQYDILTLYYIDWWLGFPLLIPLLWIGTGSTEEPHNRNDSGLSTDL